MFAVVLCVAYLLRPAPPAIAEEWLPITPEELKLTGEPLAPGAPAIYLFRQVDRNDESDSETDYVRIKILTEDGRKQADIEIPYFSRTGSVRNVRARVVHPDGAIVNFNGQIYDKTVIKARGFKYLAKTFTLPDVSVGSIVEYRYERSWDPAYVYDSHWFIDDNLFTKRAKFSLKLYSRLAVRWLSYRLPVGAALPKNPDNNTLRLEVTNLPAFQIEDYMPPEDELKARVDFIYTDELDTDPAKFWKSVGKKLNDRVESFAGKRKAIDQAAADSVSPGDPPEVKLQKLYAKVQSLHNRDEDIQKTEQELKREKVKEAANVEDIWKRSSGSGGELTLLYLALVRAAGFEAYPVMVSRRDRYFFTTNSLNSSLLNDIVVLVRLNGKDLYFDPGTLLDPFSLLPWPETSVQGLRLDKNGGSWVTTPLPPSDDSRVRRIAALRLTDEGSLVGKLTVTYTGLEALHRRRDERREDETARKKFLEDEVRISIPAAIEVELQNKPDWTSSSPELVAEFNLKIPGWASGAGRKALMSTGVFSGAEKHLFEHAKRIHPIYFDFPFQTVDDVIVELPAGWRVGSLPPAQKTDIKFCRYESSAEEKAGAVHLSRTVAVNGILLGAEAYPALRAFFQNLRAGDEQQIVILPAAAGGQN